jgi:hypothetical protein
MKRLLFLSAICSLFFGLQKANGQSTASRGSIEMPSTSKTQAVNTFYSVAASGTDKVTLQMQPDKPFTLNARIVDKDGKEIQKLTTQQVGLRYAENIDVSALPSGSYFIEVIYGENNEKNYKIPFTR